MTIVRDGAKYELTDQELCTAYYEQRHKFDMMDIQDVFDGYDNDELESVYGFDRNTINSMIEEMAFEMRRNIDKYDMSWEYARDDAINTVIDDNKD